MDRKKNSERRGRNSTGTKNNNYSTNNIKSVKENRKAKGLTEEEIKEQYRINGIKGAEQQRKNAGVVQKLSEMILQENKKTGKTFLDEWFSVFLKEAKSYPNSRASCFIATAVGLDNSFFEKADKWLDRQQKKDKDFEMWRLIKLLTPAQQQNMPDKNIKKILLRCGRRWGKTYYFGANSIIYAAYKGLPVLYINKTFTNAINQMWSPIKEMLDLAAITPFKVERSTGRIEFASKGYIQFSGHDNKSASDSFRGGEYALVGIDEAFYHKGNIKYLIEDVLEPAMGKFEDSLIIAMCSPPRSKVKFFEKMKETWVNITGTMRDNPHMSLSWGAYDQKVLEDTNTARREWQGIWEIDSESLVFHPCDWEEPVGINWIGVGLDWGSDSTNLNILGGDTITKKCWSLYEFNQSDMLVSQQIEKIKEIYNLAKEIAKEKGVTRFIPIVVDHNEKPVSQELAIIHNLPIEMAYKVDVSLTLRKMDDHMRQSKFYLQPDGLCREECDAIVWKRDDEQDALLDEIDHDVYHPQAMDSLRYVFTRFAFDAGF